MLALEIAPVVDQAGRERSSRFHGRSIGRSQLGASAALGAPRVHRTRIETRSSEHARARFLLARRGNRVVGTIGAFTNDLYNEFQGTRTGFFGFFEVVDDPEAAAALLSTAEAWVREDGNVSILGPAPVFDQR